MPHHLSTFSFQFSPSPAARHYHPALSIWLSVDPMSDKYPGLSPYTYCGNNPVRLVDPDGRDYEAVIDQDNKTITLKANIYTYTDELLQQLQSPVKELNGTHKKVEIDGREYSVSFQINIIKKENYSEANLAYQKDDIGNFFIQPQKIKNEIGGAS